MNKFLTFMKNNTSIFSYVACAFDIKFKNPLPNPKL